MSYEGPIHAAEPVAIQPRDRRFSRAALSDRWWLNGDPVATAFYNALSVSFPYGEAFFIETLRHFRTQVDPKLAAEIDAFIKQELVHAREHIALNRRVSDTGYDVRTLETRVDMRLKLLRTKGMIAGLAGTIALEHITAVFARAVLSDPSHMAGAEPEIAQMWRWHCIEEIEHKGVAYDVWQHVTRDWPPFRRWWVRNKVMFFITRRFFWDRLVGMMDLLRQDGMTGPGVFLSSFWFSLARPGMVRAILLGWAAFLRPNFHPWDHDERHLIDAALAIDPLPQH